MAQVKYDPKVCIHSGNCVKTLPAVFMVKDKKFVIVQDGAPAAEIEKTVAACPSGALSLEKTEQT